MTAPLAIYLNDHLLGATGGVELFRRATAAAQGTERAPVLAALTAEVEQDRDTLLSVMDRLGVPPRRWKVAAGWAAEKAGRLKPNGHLLTRSPLSDLVELEGLVLGVQGKAAVFRALRALGDPRVPVAELDRVVERAERQLEVLEPLRLAVAGSVLAAPGSTGG